MIDPADLFGLLREFGGSMAGAVTIRALEPAASERATGYLEELTPESLADRLRQSLKETDQGVPDDSRSALPVVTPDRMNEYVRYLCSTTFAILPGVESAGGFFGGALFS